MKKQLGIIPMVLSLTLILTACGGGGTASTNSGANSSSKTLTISQQADAVTLDPHKTNDSASANPMCQIYDTLVQLDSSMKIQPDLATEWKQVDDLTWEFKLKSGVKFHNGEELKASDVKFTFDRLLDPKTASPGAFMLTALKEVKVVDDYTVRIVTKTKFAPILYNLTHIATAILNEKAVKEAGTSYGIKPVGTGPFKFVKWDKNSQIILEKNKDYFAGPAKLDKIVIRIIPESATAVSELRTGGVDMSLDLPPQYSNQFAASGDVILEKIPSFSLKYLGFDTRVKPFNDPKVRQAINLATDKDALIKIVYQGTAQQLMAPLPPKINGADPNLKGYGYDKGKAKQLLAEAGYPNGFNSTLYLSDKEIDSKIATVLQSQLKEVGINVDLQVIEWGAYLNKTAIGVPMYILSWTTVTGDADNGMYSLFNSKNFGSPGNRSFYKNEKVDTLLDAGRAETDDAKRVKDYQDAQKLILEDAPWDFLTVNEYLVGMNKRVKGFVQMPTTMFRYYTVSVD